MRAAQTHASAVMALPMSDMTTETVEAAIEFLHATYEDFRVARAQHECDRLCVEQTLLHDDAMSCPHVNASPERLAAYIAVRRKAHLVA